jgi:hypothetical protein
VYSALTRSSQRYVLLDPKAVICEFLMNEFYRTMKGFVTHLYNEREVERAAWTKYGGPEGYEAQYVFSPL